MIFQDQPAREATHEATIDWSVLETLRSLRKADSPDPGRRLISVFINSSPALLESIRRTLKTCDPTGLANAAHSMKSGSLNMGATGLGELCAKLERAGRSGAIDEAGDLFARIEREYAAVEAAFRKFLSEN